MSTPQDLGAALAAAMAGRATQQIMPPAPLALPIDTKVQLLRQMHEATQNPHRFEVGQLVKWRLGMQTRPFPPMGDPAIVLKTLDQPLFDGTSDAAFPSFREPLDVVVGCLGPQAQFLVFHLPGFRLEPFTAPSSS
ncbi:hypothetical protein P3T20_005099 [Paraburkholderia sp. GAS206C]